MNVVCCDVKEIIDLVTHVTSSFCVYIYMYVYFLQMLGVEVKFKVVLCCCLATHFLPVSFAQGLLLWSFVLWE